MGTGGSGPREVRPRRTGDPPPEKRRRGRKGEAERVASLTPREIEVLTLLSRNSTNPKIAQNLVVSPGGPWRSTSSISSASWGSPSTQAAVRAIEAGVVL